MIALTSRVAGRFRLEARDPVSGTCSVLADWLPNMILDNGLDHLATRTDYLAYCVLGDTADPAGVTAADTALASTAPVARRYDPNVSPTYVADDTNGYASATLVYVFEPDVIAEVTELGICPDEDTGGIDPPPEIGSLFSRVVPPAPISVPAGSELVVTYELRQYWPTDPLVQVVDGVEITTRADKTYYVDTQGNLQSDWRPWPGDPYQRRFQYRYADSAMRLIEPEEDYAGSGSGPNTEVVATAWVVEPAYVPGSFTRTWDIDVPPSDVVFTQDRIAAMTFFVGPLAMRSDFVPYVTKTAHHRLQFQVQLRWSRATPHEELP